MNNFCVLKMVSIKFGIVILYFLFFGMCDGSTRFVVFILISVTNVSIYNRVLLCYVVYGFFLG